MRSAGVLAWYCTSDQVDFYMKTCKYSLLPGFSQVMSSNIYHLKEMMMKGTLSWIEVGQAIQIHVLLHEFNLENQRRPINFELLPLEAFQSHLPIKYSSCNCIIEDKNAQ